MYPCQNQQALLADETMLTPNKNTPDPSIWAKSSALHQRAVSEQEILSTPLGKKNRAPILAVSWAPCAAGRVRGALAGVPRSSEAVPWQSAPDTPPVRPTLLSLAGCGNPLSCKRVWSRDQGFGVRLVPAARSACKLPTKPAYFFTTCAKCQCLKVKFFKVSAWYQSGASAPQNISVARSTLPAVPSSSSPGGWDGARTPLPRAALLVPSRACPASPSVGNLHLAAPCHVLDVVFEVSPFPRHLWLKDLFPISLQSRF